MKYIEQLKDGDRVGDIYLCKEVHSLTTKNGKPYLNLMIQDKTGVINAKIWDVNSGGIEDFDALDYIDVVGNVTEYNGALQVNVSRVRKCNEGEYDPADYLPVSRFPVEEMYTELCSYIEEMQNPYLKLLCQQIFVKDAVFADRFKKTSAAKMVHHGFVGGLLEHTLSVTRNCRFFAQSYPMLNKDLLVTAALCHDIGKVRELSAFPLNDYTDEGQLLGHIVMGSEMVSAYSTLVPDFPQTLLVELKHCILAHHGELEYGSPKKPALAEAVALNFADNIDAKMETLREEFEKTPSTGWLGFNRFMDSNIRKTSESNV